MPLTCTFVEPGTLRYPGNGYTFWPHQGRGDTMAAQDGSQRAKGTGSVYLSGGYACASFETGAVL